MRKGGDFAVGGGSESGTRRRVQECVMNVAEAGEDKLGGGCDRHADFGGEPGNGVGYTLGASVPHPNGVAPIGFQGGADVPAIEGMWRPGLSVLRLLVDKDANARGASGVALKS